MKEKEIAALLRYRSCFKMFSLQGPREIKNVAKAVNC